MYTKESSNKEQLVDFDQLFQTVNPGKELPEDVLEVSLTKEEFTNLQVFIKTLSRSSTFAHKAHKELREIKAKQ